eukprot:gene24599-3687_t
MPLHLLIQQPGSLMAAAGGGGGGGGGLLQSIQPVTSTVEVGIEIGMSHFTDDKLSESGSAQVSARLRRDKGFAKLYSEIRKTMSTPTSSGLNNEGGDQTNIAARSGGGGGAGSAAVGAVGA